MISTSKKLIFVHIPKTGGSSIELILNPYLDDKVIKEDDKHINIKTNFKNNLGVNYKHATATELKLIYGDDIFNNYHKFTVIRHPYDRLLSLHFWVYNSWNLNKFKKGLSTSITSDDIKTNRHIGPLSYFIEDSNGDLLIDRIIKFDNLNNEFNELCKDFGISEQLIHLNKTKHMNHSKYYDKEIYDMIDSAYQDEIDKYW